MLFYRRNGLFLNETWARVFIKAAQGGSAFLAAGHRGDVHPAAVCPVLSLPQAGGDVSGGSAGMGFCLLKRRK